MSRQRARWFQFEGHLFLLLQSVCVPGGCGRCRWVRRRCGEAKCSQCLGVEPVVEGETMEPKRFKNHKRRGFGTPVGDVVEPLDISMATWSLSRLGGRPYLLVSHSKPHPKAPELGQDHLLPCISTAYKYVRTCLRCEMSGCPGHAVRARYLKTG